MIRDSGVISATRRKFPPPSRLREPKAEGYGDQHQRGGMAVLFRGQLPKGAVSTANFKLPGAATPLQTEVQIAWMDESGRAGMRFTTCPRSPREQLDRWLAEQGEKIDERPTE